MPKIVISYRRQDSEAIAGRIRDRLVGHYGIESVFMDIDSIPFGTDFREHIRNVLTTTDVVIAIIGPRWTGGSRGRPARIREPADPVRIEVERAFENNIPLVPVLVNGARMPKTEELPDSLQDLSYRNAAEVDSGRDFHQHLDRLIRSLDQILSTRPQATGAEGPAPVAGQPAAVLASPPPAGPGASDTAAKPAAAAPVAPEPAAPVPAGAPVGAAPAPRRPMPRWPIIVAAAAIIAVLGLFGIYRFALTPADNRNVTALREPAPAPPLPAPVPPPVPATYDTSCKRSPGAVFHDDFKSPDGGWGQSGDTKSFKDGRMVLRPKADAASSWLYLPLLFSKRIVACAEIIAPSEIASAASDAAGGIMFWAIDYDNYYVAEIYPNGTYSVWRRLNGTWIPVVPRRPSPALRQGAGAVNQVTIATGQKEATLSINGAEVITFWGQPPRRGGAVGLFGQSETTASNEWRFSGIDVAEDPRAPKPPAAAAVHAAFAGSCAQHAALGFVDEFAPPDAGWGTGDDRRFFRDHEMILKPATNTFESWIFLPLRFTGAAVCADVKSPPAVKDSDGAAKGGVIFWASDLRNFYLAQLYPDGAFAIYRRIDGRWAQVLPRTKNAAIHTGVEAVNRIKVAFDGNAATLTVNDAEVAKLSRGQPPAGGGAVGLYAESETGLENEWRFLRVAVMEDERPGATTSSAPASAATACKPAAPAVFADDFATPDPGWGASGSDYRFADKQMVLLPKADTNVTWIYTPLVFTGASACVELRIPPQVKKADDVACGGLVFWAADYKNYYLAAICLSLISSVARSSSVVTLIRLTASGSSRISPPRLRGTTSNHLPSILRRTA